MLGQRQTTLLYFDPLLTARPVDDPEAIKHEEQLAKLFTEVAANILKISDKYLPCLVHAKTEADHLASAVTYVAASLRAAEHSLADDQIYDAELRFKKLAELCEPIQIKQSETITADPLDDSEPQEPPVILALTPKQRENFEFALSRRGLYSASSIIGRIGPVSREELYLVTTTLKEHNLSRMLEEINQSVRVSDEEKREIAKINFCIRLGTIEKAFVSAKDAFVLLLNKQQISIIPETPNGSTISIGQSPPHLISHIAPVVTP